MKEIYQIRTAVYQFPMRRTSSKRLTAHKVKINCLSSYSSYITHWKIRAFSKQKKERQFINSSLKGHLVCRRHIPTPIIDDVIDLHKMQRNNKNGLFIPAYLIPQADSETKQALRRIRNFLIHPDFLKNISRFRRIFLIFDLVRFTTFTRLKSVFKYTC